MKTLCIAHINFQNVSEKNMQLKSGFRRKHYCGYIRKLAHIDDKTSLCNVALNTFELIRFDKSAIISATKRGVVTLFLVLKLANILNH